MNPLKRTISIAIVTALVSGLSGWSVYAGTAPDSDSPVKSSESSAARKDKNEKVKADMLKLLAEAKAGKVAPAPQQFPRTAKNNLSTGAKIGIVAAIGGAIFLIWMFHELSKD